MSRQAAETYGLAVRAPQSDGRADIEHRTPDIEYPSANSTSKIQCSVLCSYVKITIGTELAADRRMPLKETKAIQNSYPFSRLLSFTGQSFRDEIQELSSRGLIPLLLFSLAFWIVCAVAWTQKFAGENPDPRFWTFLSLVVTAYGGFQVFRLRRSFMNFPVPEGGEDKVEKILARLKWAGFVAFHELPNSGLNVDHVVVGPSGIYAIETKTRSGSGSIVHRSDRELIFGGRIIDGRSLRQTQNSARAVHRLLEERLKQAYPVKPILVFCGTWQVERPTEDLAVDVLTPEELQHYFERQQPKLTIKEIVDICSQLEHSDSLRVES